MMLYLLVVLAAVLGATKSDSNRVRIMWVLWGVFCLLGMGVMSLVFNSGFFQTGLENSREGTISEARRVAGILLAISAFVSIISIWAIPVPERNVTIYRGSMPKLERVDRNYIPRNVVFTALSSFCIGIMLVLLWTDFAGVKIAFSNLFTRIGF